MPMWMLALSAIHPMSGSRARPGMAHHDATENPTARALAGIASDRIARIPGSRMASVEVSRMLATIATHSTGTRAKNATKAAASRATVRRKRKIRAGLRRNSLVPSLAPTARPISWNGSIDAAR
jgi:hypothetical protein